MNNGYIVYILGIVIAAVTIASGLMSGINEITSAFFYKLILFSLFAYVPYGFLGYVIKKNSFHSLFLTFFGVFLFCLNLFFVYQAMFVSQSSTGALVFVVMPVYLTGAVLLMRIFMHV